MTLALATLPRTTDQIADEILEINAQIHASMTKTIDHMIECGHKLIEAQALVPKGEWGEWSKERLGLHRKTVSTYIRFARYEDLLRDRGITTSIDARKLLATLDLPRANSAEHFALEAKAMRRQGKTIAEIADYFGVSHARVSQWIDRESFMRRARKQRVKTAKAKRLLKQHEDKKAVKRSDKGVADAYAHVRKALEALQSVEAKGEKLQSINKAILRLYDAEDMIVRASKS